MQLTVKQLWKILQKLDKFQQWLLYLQQCCENKKGYFKDNDVKKAKEYLEKGLKEMGLKMLQKYLLLKFHYNTDEGHQKVAQAVQDMWKKNLGVEVH